MIGEESETCPFCNIQSQEDQVLYRNDKVTALLSKSQVKKGHTLIIPNDHVTSLKELDEDTCVEMFNLLSNVVDSLEKELDIDGYNVAINQGSSAGQTVRHLHIHILPREEGDIEEPEKWLNSEIIQQERSLEEIDAEELVESIKGNL